MRFRPGRNEVSCEVKARNRQGERSAFNISPLQIAAGRTRFGGPSAHAAGTYRPLQSISGDLSPTEHSYNTYVS
jgi:hypothetical protein